MAKMVPGAKRSCRATRTSCCLPSVTTAKLGRCPSWSNSKCSFTAPLVRRNCAQSNTDAHRAITVASRLRSLFLKRNFLFFFAGDQDTDLCLLCWGIFLAADGEAAGGRCGVSGLSGGEPAGFPNPLGLPQAAPEGAARVV